MATRPAPGPELEVSPPSAAAETGLVVRAVFHVGFWSAIAVAWLHAPGAGTAETLGLQYDEVAFSALPPAEQRVYRLLREGVQTAERTRGRTGAWPEVSALVARGVAPFVDPIDAAGYRWTRVADGPTVDYVGAPDPASGLGTFLVVLLEPPPGTPVDPTAVADEVHRLLRDGTLLHVTIWRAPGARTIAGAVAAPAVEDGWRRVIVGT